VAKIKREIYRKILESLQLRKLYLQNFKGQIHLDIIPKAAIVDIACRAKFVLKAENQVEISQTWNIVARDKKSKSECIRISVTYCLVLDSKEKFTKDFFEIYEKTSLPLNVWPFVREFVNSMTARMNVPPLTLPLFKVPEKR
jgi:preprotein translocase subunit SecB